MKMTAIILSALTLASSAFATPQGHGVERILPADAKNVRLFSAELAPYATGQRLIADGNDGPVYENTYSTVLNVVVFYDSKDLTDDYYSRGSDESGNHVGFGPASQDAVVYNFRVNSDQIAAIKAGSLNPNTLVNVAVASKTVQMDDPRAEAVCRYDNDSNLPLNSCVEPAPAQINVVRPVLNVTLK